MIRAPLLRSAATLLLLFSGLSTPAQAQDRRPAMTLVVDASGAPGKILHVKESLSGLHAPLTLFYPKWIPGEHGPTGPVIDLAGLQMSAAGKQVSWRRDLEEMYEIHCDLPAGADQVDLTFDFL